MAKGTGALAAQLHLSKSGPQLPKLPSRALEVPTEKHERVPYSRACTCFPPRAFVLRGHGCHVLFPLRTHADKYGCHVSAPVHTHSFFGHAHSRWRIRMPQVLR